MTRHYCPVKLMFVQEGSVIRCYLGADINDRFEVASVATKFCNDDPEFFNKWKTALAEAFTVSIGKMTGVKPDNWEEIKTNEAH